MKTNVQRIKSLTKKMESDSMMQFVVIHALTNYCEIVKNTKKKPKDWPMLIDWESWKAAAIRVLPEFDYTKEK